MSTDFGRDLWCTDELRTGRFVSGLRLLAQAAYRRITTPRGTLRGGEAEENYGLDLVGLVGSIDVDNLVASLPDRIRLELLKDERIEGVETEVDRVDEGPGTRFLLTISIVSALGPFSLRVSVNEVSAELLGITEEAA